MEELVAVVQEEEELVPLERMLQRTVEQVPVLQIPVETVEAVLASDGTSATTDRRSCASGQVSPT